MEDDPNTVPALEVITSTDRSGLIVAVSAIVLSFVLICVLVRLFVRLFVSGPWRWDDGALSAAAVFTCIQSALVFSEVSKGYGMSIADLKFEDLVEIGKTAYASDMFYLFTFFLSKCSTGLLFLRLTPTRGLNNVAWSLIGASAIWALLSLFLITIRCNPAHPWIDLAEQCSGLSVRWQVIGIFSIITEAALFLTSFYLVAELQMPLRLKATIVTAFSVRLPVIIASGFRLYYLKSMINSSNPTLAGASVVLCTQVELNYSLIASSVSCLGPFLSPFSTSYHESRAENSSGQRSGASYILESVSRSGKPVKSIEKIRNTTREIPSGDKQIPQTNHPSHATTISHSINANHDHHSLNSNDSKRMIIQKKMTWSVEHDENSQPDESIMVMDSNYQGEKSV
ncbi:MAG: hypothetical protein M1837_002733 [Sclerophora amabilis]|nr:MAG: hypothetical protein M1837_002733 [Sclerophora amabilis]